jgi:hypothetical protein
MLTIKNKEEVLEAIADDKVPNFAKRSYIVSALMYGLKGLINMSHEELENELMCLDLGAFNTLLSSGDVVVSDSKRFSENLAEEHCSYVDGMVVRNSRI